jgi:SAM-dependent methyltransferase
MIIGKVKSLVRRVVGRLVAPFLGELRGDLKRGLEQRLAPTDPRVVENPYLSGKLVPLAANAGGSVVLRRSAPQLEQGLPVPPRELWQGYGETAAEFLAMGREDVADMMAILRGAGVDTHSLHKVLDFGCGAGRVLRFFPRNSESSEHWGVDVNANYIAWCQQNLGPPMSFATTTSAPHLPFEDNTFDLVYCASVFTHISDLADAWLLELRRVLRKGGCAYITIHDKHTLARLFGKYRDVPGYEDFVADVKRHHELASGDADDFYLFTIGADPTSQVFYDIDWLLAKWSRLMKVLATVEDGHGPQTVVVFQKAPA